jgi:hypothetical protein
LINNLVAPMATGVSTLATANAMVLSPSCTDSARCRPLDL